jgi:hypothetical protein
LRTIFRYRRIEDKSPGSQSALSPNVDLASSRVGSAQAVCTCRKEKSRNVCKVTTAAKQQQQQQQQIKARMICLLIFKIAYTVLQKN